MNERKPRRNRGRIIRRGLTGLILTILAVVLGIVLLLATSPGGRLAATLVNRLGSNEIRALEIDSIAGLIGGHTKIGHLLISDANGDPWLLLKGIELDWSPLAVISYDLKIERLLVRNIELARLPENDPASENELTGSFKLPLNIEIEKLELPDILVGESIAGVVGRFAASGAFQVNSDLSNVKSDLAINRIDGVGGAVGLLADINLADEQFDLDLDFSEPAGGVLAHLAGLSKSDAVAIKANTSGQLSDWALKVTGDINNVRVANADIAVRQRDNGHIFDATVTGALGRFLPPSIAGLFSGNSDIVAAGLLEPENTGVQLDVFTFKSASLSAEGQGRLARDGASNFQASLSGAKGPVNLTFGEADGAISLALASMALSVNGPADDARVELHTLLPSVDMAQLSAKDIAATIDLTGVNLTERSGSGTLGVNAASVGSASPALARALAGNLKLDSDLVFDAGTVSTSKTNLTTATTSLQLAGTFDVATLTGTGNLAGRVRSAVLGADLPKTLGPEIALAGDFALSENNAVTLENLEITANQLTVTGKAGITGERAIAAELAAELTDVAALNPLATGALSMQADMTGTLFAPEFSLAITGRNIAVDTKPVDDLKITANGELIGASPRADVEISGRYLGQPIIGKAHLAQSNGRNEINPLQLVVADNRITGSLELDAAYRPSGVIDLMVPDIASLAALAGLEITGQGQGQLVFSVEDDIPVMAADIAVAELAGTGFSLSGAQAKATIDNFLAEPQLAGNVAVATVISGKTSVRNIDVKLQLDGGWTRFDGNAEADGSPVAVAGRLGRIDGTTIVELDEGRVTYKGLPVRLTEPARLSMNDGTVRIEQLSLSPGSGSVSVAGTAGQSLNLDVRLSSVSLTAVDAVAPGTGLRGTVSGTVKVTGTASSPVASYDLTADGVGASALSSVTPSLLSGNASGVYSGSTVSLNAAARDGSGLAFAVNGNIGLTGNRAISLKAGGTAPFSLIAARLAAQGLVLEGAAIIDLTVGGTLSTPDYNGTIRSSGARFVDTTTGIAIQDLATEVSLNRQSVQVRSLTGQLSTGGQLAGSGTIGLDGSQGYPGNLEIKVTNGRYADGKMVATRFNAALTLSGPLARQPTLSGNLDLDQTTITVAEVPPGAISQLDVTHLNADAKVQAQAERINQANAGNTQSGFGLDLRINAPNRIFVRGRGIEAEFGGALTLRGSTALPQAIGGFDLVRGRLDILGKRLNFDSGRITFAGSMIPTLDFAASTSAGSATATVLVTGLATSPVFKFTSSPELPEDEVLSLLIFGRSLANLSPLQIAQLASAAAELTGVTSGGGLVDQLRKATGIDSLDVKTDEKTGETSVAVGKYLDDRTYLGIEKGATAGSGKATIDLNLGRGLKLRGEASSEGETRGGIFFERDY